MLRSTRALDDHARELALALNGQDPDPGRSARFIRTFVRPGLAGLPATAQFVRELESLAARPAPEPVPAAAWTRLVQPLLKPFARAAIERLRDIKAERTLQKDLLLEEHRRRKATALRSRRKADPVPSETHPTR